MLKQKSIVKEPITTKHFFRGIATKKTALKSVAFGVWLALFVLAGFTIYKAFFVKTSQQMIVAKKGSKVEVTQINKASRFFIPYIEAGVEQRSDSNMGTYIRAGLRVEF